MTNEQEAQLLRGLLMQALERISNIESQVGGLKQFHEAVAPRIERNTTAIIDLESQRASYGKMAWVIGMITAAIVGAFVGHLMDIYWRL